jgi:hypothetical protein
MRARRKHSREFKVEAVRLVRERGVTVAHVTYREHDPGLTVSLTHPPRGRGSVFGTWVDYATSSAFGVGVER